MWDSRVQLDPKVKDYWGLPVARISGSKHPLTSETGAFMAAHCQRWLLEAGATTTWASVPSHKSLSGGQHQAGTCRMGNDPKTSVLNRYCQSHEIDNLFVVDGSVHVTNGAFNPALTIMAVAYWAAHHIVKGWNGTRFRS